MGKPAARLGDTTSHGGSIVAGAPTVLIGGQPAARANDMHVCPMLNPGVPPPPHVGGPVLLGSPTVLICGQMAARMGDMAQCSGPPDSIVAGCPTVLIGEVGAGGGGGGGPAGAAASAAMAGKDPDSEEDHFLNVKFVDKKGNPIRGVNYAIKTPDNKKIKGILGGQLKKTGVKEGNYEIQLVGFASAEWSVSEANVGEKVKLAVRSFGIESGAPIIISIIRKDISGAERLAARIDSKIKDDKAEEDWEFPEEVEVKSECKSDTEKKEKYSKPEYYFRVMSDYANGRSGSLYYKDSLEFTLKDKDGKGIADQEYRITLSNGEIRTGKLDSNGHAKEENIPPVSSNIEFEDMPFHIESDSEPESDTDDQENE